jgi:flagellin
MALGVLNNISAIYAQNNLANTQASLSKTLQQLSSGSRINSGADDAAGLSLANGLQASATALSQSAKNASQGVDFLQVADGALSQVTSLLNRAVTLATEASNGTLNGNQTTAANSEYQKILTEIDTINNNTESNGIHTFAANSTLTAGSAVSDGLDLKVDKTLSFTANGKTITMVDSAKTPTAGQFKLTGPNNKLSDLASAINTGVGSNVAAVINNQLILGGNVIVGGSAGAGDLQDTLKVAGVSTLQAGSAGDTLTPGGTTVSVTLANGTSLALDAKWTTGTGTGGNLAQLAADINTAYGGAGNLASVAGNHLVLANGAKFAGTIVESETAGTSSNSTVAIFTSDGTINQTYNSNASDLVKTDTSALNLNATDLTSSSNSQDALTKIAAAITTVAASRGTVGANINTLTAVGNVMTTQSTNTLAAQNDVTATDYGQATSDMSKFQILSQTGIAALAQANQSQQLITKLLQ